MKRLLLTVPIGEFNVCEEVRRSIMRLILAVENATQYVGTKTVTDVVLLLHSAWRSTGTTADSAIENAMRFIIAAEQVISRICTKLIDTSADTSSSLMAYVDTIRTAKTALYMTIATSRQNKQCKKSLRDSDR